MGVEHSRPGAWMFDCSRFRISMLRFFSVMPMEGSRFVELNGTRFSVWETLWVYHW